MFNFDGTSDGRSARRQSWSDAATVLMGRLLRHPTVRGRSAAEPDAELLPFASALLQSRLAFDRTIGPELSGAPLWNILLLVYAQQANSGGLQVPALPELPTIGPATVLVRWTIKLVSDGLLELAENAAPEGEPVVRLTSDGLHRIELWLRLAKAEFGMLV